MAKEKLYRITMTESQLRLMADAVAVKDIFPELAESEDERIKTFIRGLILPHIADAHIVDDKIVYNKDIDNYRKALAWLEKQGEQKPVEWSEEDEKLFKTALWHISHSISNGKSTDCHCDTTDWLKSLKDRVQPQPRQEWSEEDEAFYQRLEQIVCKVDIEAFQGDIDLHSWLKSLKLQNTWKPSMAQLNALSIVSKGNAPDDIEAIVSLYNILKKLMEE